MGYDIRWVLLAVAFASCPVILPAYAGEYPERPVRFIIPFTAGGGNDAIGRILAQKLTETWGQQIVADNRVGANGVIGTQLAAKASPDGYTWVLVSTSFTMNPAMRKLPYDPRKDFSPVALAAGAPIILATSQSFPARSIAELVTMAKAKPGELQFASTGVGGANHLAGELFQRLAGISMLHVAYKGGSEAAIDVMTGRVAVMFSSVPVVISHIRSGKMRGLGLGDLKRSSLLPDVPTIAESGVPGYEAGFWFGIMVPSGTPKAIVSKINADINRSLESPDVQQRLSAIGMQPLKSTVEEFSRLVDSDMVKWGRVITDIGLAAK